jgi:3-methyladenine DNA glycosylase AlkD
MKAKNSTAAASSVSAILAWLEGQGSLENQQGMARYGITSKKAFGVPVGTLRTYAKELGQSHELSLALWATGYYEARLLAAFVDEPARVTSSQMDAWCKEFDNWAVCDTVCFHLFDRTSLAYAKVKAWAGRKAEFEKRAAFALLASLALHDKHGKNELFLPTFSLIEAAADDERNFVKKAVSWALRGVGERNAELHAQALALAQRLQGSKNSTVRWVGRDAWRELDSEKVRTRLLRKTARSDEATGERPASKRSPAKKAAKSRAPAKKAPAKKAPAKKAPAKKAPAQRPSEKQTPAKRAPAQQARKKAPLRKPR